MARTVRGLSPSIRPRPRPRPRPGTGHSLDHRTGLDPEPKLSVSAGICVRTQSAPRVSSVRYSQRTPLLRSRTQALPPARPRSPTPRVGRRSVHRKPGYQRQGSAQCTALPEPVARGDHKTPSRGARGWGKTARAPGRVSGEHCLPSDVPGLSSAAPRSPSHPAFRTPPRPAPSDWNPRARSLERQNFPSLTLTPVHFHPTPPFQPFPHLPTSLQTL